MNAVTFFQLSVILPIELVLPIVTLPSSTESRISPVMMDLGLGAVDPQDGGVNRVLPEDPEPTAREDCWLPADTLGVSFRGLLNWKSCQDQHGAGYNT